MSALYGAAGTARHAGMAKAGVLVPGRRRPDDTTASAVASACLQGSARSVVAEADEIRLAASMIQLGARLQLLLSETSLSRERLSRLYREIRSELPPKGMLPFSVDWHMTWMPNIHSSVFYNIYKFMLAHSGKTGVEALVDTYRAYVDQMYETEFSGEPVLSFTRAWMMVRFFDAGMLELRRCSCCGGNFVVHAHDLPSSFVCGLCRLPPRAGKRLNRSDKGAPE